MDQLTHTVRKVELDKHHSTVPGQTGRHYGKAVAC